MDTVKGLHRFLGVYLVQFLKSWQDTFMYQNLRTRLQGRYKVLENLYTILVGPIMKDGPEIIYICADRLFGKEITAAARMIRI